MEPDPGLVEAEAEHGILTAAREEFPITEKFLHFDSAGLMLATSVRDRVLSLYDEAHQTGGDKRAWKEEAETTRAKLAALIGARADEVAFTKNTSEGLNIAAHAIPWRPGDNALIARGEHPNNAYALLSLRSRGVEVRQVPTTGGWLDAGAFAPHVDERTRAISMSHVSASPGQRHDTADVARLCRDRGAYLIVDAIQSVGTIDFDVSDLRGRALVAAGCHKGLMALPGLGFLYCDRSLTELNPAYAARASVANMPPDQVVGPGPVELHKDARRFEIGNLNYPGLRALNASLDLISRLGVPAIERHVLSLADRLIAHLDELGVGLIGPRSPRERRSHIVVLDLPGGEWAGHFEEYRVVVRAKPDATRVSFTMFNSAHEVDQLAGVIKRGLNRGLPGGGRA